MSDTATQPPCRASSRVQRRDQGRAPGQQLGLANVMQVPTLEKIVINMGVGRATQQPSLLEGAVTDLTRDHRPEADRHQGEEVDRRLQAPRGSVDRLQGHAARRPHVGVPRPARSPSPSPASATSAACRRTSWDGRGNYTFGLNEQTVFPEIDYDKIDTPRGMDITIVTTAHQRRSRQGAARCVRLPVQAGRRRRRTADEGQAPRSRPRSARAPARPRRSKKK